MVRVENFNREIMRQTAEGLDTAKTAKFSRLDQWIKGIQFPTFNQLADYAKAVNLPFGYFFLDELPERPYPIPHFRTKEKGSFRPSAELFDTIYDVKERQAWVRDLLVESGVEPLYFAATVSTADNVVRTANMLREILHLVPDWAQRLKSWKDAFRLLVDRAEMAGIFVISNGVVGNNPHRKLNVEEFRGFVLYDDIAPFIFVNGSDFVAGKTFTLVHEMAHILVGVSASFDLKELRAGDQAIEVFCDNVAAEFLVPTAELLPAYRQIGLNYNLLARTFKVSRLVIARRLLDLEVISKDEFFQLYNSWADEYLKKEKGGEGGHFYNTSALRVGRRFFDVISTAVKRDKILYRDAFRLTGLSPKTYDEFEKRRP